MVVSTFFMLDKDSRERFFEKSFLLADVKQNIVLGILFLTMSNADINFQAHELQWRSYTTGDILLTTRRVKLIGKKKFTAAALDLEHKAFVVYIAALSIDSGDEVYPSRRAQIADLKVDEASTKVLTKYVDFVDVFSPKLAIELPKHTGINDHAIELVNNWQTSYDPINILGPVELETLKAYIKNNLANGFIRPSKFPSGATILFDKKSKGSLRLYVNYQGLNNLTIKNWYPLYLVEESLNRLSWTQRFTQLNLTNTYHQMRIRGGDKWKTGFRTRYGHFEY